MIFSLPKALTKTVEKVQHNSKSVAFSWGNTDALNKWIISMDKKKIDAVLGLSEKTKYPLIWLVDNWIAEEVPAGYKFKKVSFWISSNSKIETLNENRDFTTQYEVANKLIETLKLNFRISKDSISWTEKSNVSTQKKSTESEKKSSQCDIWDSVILTLDLVVYKNCLSKLYV